jgi:hypothetical protein
MKKLSNYLLKFPKITLVVILLITLIFSYIIKNNIRMETDLDEYMPKDHPAFVYSDEAEEIFDIKDGILIAIENPQGIYKNTTLQKIKNLTKELGKLKQIDRSAISSLYTADNIVGTEYGLDVTSFYSRLPLTEDELAKLKQDVRSNDMIYGRFVSQNEQVTLIVAEIDDDVFTQEFYHGILDMANSFEGPEQVYVAGSPIVEGTMAYLMPEDMKKMVPLVVLVIILVLFCVLRSIKNTISTLLVVLFSVIWAFGLMSAFGIPVYAVSTMIPVMLIAIGVADGVHLYSHLQLYLQKNPKASRSAAVQDMLKEMRKPVIMTSVTTSVGFVSLLTAKVLPIKYFGVFTAFGVMAAMLFSLIMIPAFVLVFGYSKPAQKKTDKTQKSGKPFSYKFANSVIKHNKLVVVLTILIVGLSVFGITKVWINSSFLDKFEKDSDIVLTDKFINQHFGGTSTLNVILEAESNDTMKSPEVLRLVEKMQERVVSKLDMVGNSFGLSDYILRMNMVMHENKQKYETIPDSRELIAQYLLLYEMSGDPENLWKVVDYDYKKANVTFQMKSDNSKVIKQVLAEIDGYTEEFNKLGVDINYAGSGYKALVFTELILEGQIKSLLLSLVIIVILLSLMFKKVKAGIIGAVPIAITATIGFGSMGFLNIPLSTTTALISSIAIGIGIDYAVHFIERYKIYAKQTNIKQITTEKTMHHSGRAIIFNAAVVIAGFLVLLFSVFPPNRSLGALVSLNMFTSFLGTVTIMYLLLYKTNLFFKNKQVKQQ